MAITKTKFINYGRCKRYVALDDVKKNRLDADISYEEYLEEELEEKVNELISSMYDGDDDLVDIVDPQLEVMLPYYNKIELLAGDIAHNYFDGKFKYAWDTANQESFDAIINGIKYLCYVDIYNETKDAFNIIEVKATSTRNFFKDGLFTKVNGIYHLLDEIGADIEDFKKYENNKRKLYDKLSGMGHYVYDLAVQRYIIENDLKNNNDTSKIDKIKYYLAVLNHEYVFDGTYKNGEPVYNKDINGNDIICYLDLTEVTKDLMDKIDIDRKKIESYLLEMDASNCPIGLHCEHKSKHGCKYFKVCASNLKENNVLNYIDAHHGFKDSLGNKYDRFELINSGIYNMVDVPDDYLNREKNRIQKKCVLNNEVYTNLDKISAGISQIEYPIYHLDFETFPCPLPRYRGEKCYTQSVFQFSLHIEKSPGICDKEKDHYGYLADTHEDIREELIKKMIELIDISKGTILVYNDSFEKTRLSELAEIFPLYKKELLKMKDMVFDLMNIVKTRSSLYEELGFDIEEAKLFNYYHKDMCGSFSIKKILPLFTNLSYKDLEIGNGTEALVTYAKFPKFNEEEFDYFYNSLIEYCKQDTWAMVEILKGLRDLVNDK